MITEIDLYGSVLYSDAAFDGGLGLGKEPISADSVGFMARAFHNGYLAKNVYSYEPSNPTASLVLGGFNQTRFARNSTVITSASDTLWNTTLSFMSFGNTTLWNNTLQTKGNSSAYF